MATVARGAALPAEIVERRRRLAIFSGSVKPCLASQCFVEMFQFGNFYMLDGALGSGFLGDNFLP
ncbi:MAG TPA: hypothetical protein PLF25_04515 [Accumulibacter sp.]|jgi:hypothetical protein|nr:hypothetical protein [Accumulibacter sp.]